MVTFAFRDLISKDILTTGSGSIVTDGIEKAVLTEVAGLDTFSSIAVAPPLLHDVVLGDQVTLEEAPVEATFSVDGLEGVALIEEKFPSGRGVYIETYGMGLPLKVLSKSTSLFGKETKVTVYFQKLGGWAQDFCGQTEGLLLEKGKPESVPAGFKWKTAFSLELEQGNSFEGSFPWEVSVSIVTPVKNLMSPTTLFPHANPSINFGNLSFGFSEIQTITQKLTYVISSTQAGSFSVLKEPTLIRSSAPFEGSFVLGTSSGTETKTISLADCLQTISTEVNGAPLVTTPELFLAEGSAITFSGSFSSWARLRYSRYNDKVIL